MNRHYHGMVYKYRPTPFGASGDRESYQNRYNPLIHENREMNYYLADALVWWVDGFPVGSCFEDKDSPDPRDPDRTV